MKEELIEALERLVKANKNNTGESVMGAIENAEKALQKVNQQPELSAEEFLRSKMEKEDLKDYFANFYFGISGKRYYLADLLTEFKNYKCKCEPKSLDKKYSNCKKCGKLLQIKP